MFKSFIAKKNPFISVDMKKLKDKLNGPIPSWVESQISEDLSLFEGADLDEKNVDLTFKGILRSESGNSSCLHKFIIRDNSLVLPKPIEVIKIPRIFKMVMFLRGILKLLPFPDIEFLFSAADLHENKCFHECQSVPVFVISRVIGDKYSCLFPHVEWINYWSLIRRRINSKNNHVPWSNRKSTLFWRGSTTGMGYPGAVNTRCPVVQLSAHSPLDIDASFSCLVDIDEDLKKKIYNMGWVKADIPAEKQVGYKYLLAIDGHCFPGSFFWQLSSGSVFFKQDSLFLEWYYGGLKPYIHYIPFTSDASDLIKKKKWAQENDSAVKEIAKNSMDFARDFLSNEDIIIYVYQLLWKYKSCFRK